MNSYSFVLYIIAALAIAYAAGHIFGFFLKRSRLASTDATVYSISLSDTKRARTGSKWGKVEYKVKGRKYVSDELIPIPQDAQIGTKVPVQYDPSSPETLYRFSWTQILVAAGLAVICILGGILL